MSVRGSALRRRRRVLIHGLRRCGDLTPRVMVVMVMIVMMILEGDFLILKLYHDRLIYHD
jgi:hypothetical protein